jgi:hypothetical protein
MMARRKIVALAVVGAIVVFLLLWITPMFQRTKFTGVLLDYHAGGSLLQPGHVYRFLSLDGAFEEYEIDFIGGVGYGGQYDVISKLNIFGYPVSDFAIVHPYNCNRAHIYLALAFNSTPNSTNWFDSMDINRDSRIDILDAINIARDPECP